MNCWKCGAPTLNGAAECELCEIGAQIPITRSGDNDEDIEMVEIDYNKITTLEDLKLVIQELGWFNFVPKNSPECEALKRFLKES